MRQVASLASPPQNRQPLNEQRGDIVTSHISTRVAFPGQNFCSALAAALTQYSATFFRPSAHRNNSSPNTERDFISESGAASCQFARRPNSTHKDFIAETGQPAWCHPDVTVAIVMISSKHKELVVETGTSASRRCYSVLPDRRCGTYSMPLSVVIENSPRDSLSELILCITCFLY
jgi:hypothetical protein